MLPASSGDRLSLLFRWEGLRVVWKDHITASFESAQASLHKIETQESEFQKTQNTDAKPRSHVPAWVLADLWSVWGGSWEDLGRCRVPHGGMGWPAECCGLPLASLASSALGAWACAPVGIQMGLMAKARSV